MMQTTGLDLKLARVAARVTARSLARRLAVGESRVSHIESQAVVTASMATRYRAALDLEREQPGETADGLGHREAETE